MRIGVDIDGVITDFVDGFVSLVKEKYSFIIRESDIIYHDLDLVLGIPKNEAYNLVFENLVNRLSLIDGAKKGLIELSNAGHSIHIITARPSSLNDITVSFLKDNGIPFSSIVYLNHSEKHLCDMKLDVVIEDSLVDAINFATCDSDCVVLLFSHPWNRSINVKNLFTRVKSWGEIVFIIKDLNRRRMVSEGRWL